MTIQSQLDQVLALFDLPDTPLNGVLVAEHCYAFMKEHGPAIRAAVGGEAVAKISVSEKSIDLHRRRRQESELGNDAALRAYLGDGIHKLYASPTATVDVGALRELVEKWRRLSGYEDEHGELEVGEGSATRLRVCADELAVLIAAGDALAAPIGEEA